MVSTKVFGRVLTAAGLLGVIACTQACQTNDDAKVGVDSKLQKKTCIGGKTETGAPCEPEVNFGGGTSSSSGGIREPEGKGFYKWVSPPPKERPVVRTKCKFPVEEVDAPNPKDPKTWAAFGGFTSLGKNNSKSGVSRFFHNGRVTFAEYDPGNGTWSVSTLKTNPTAADKPGTMHLKENQLAGLHWAKGYIVRFDPVLGKNRLVEGIWIRIGQLVPNPEKVNIAWTDAKEGDVTGNGRVIVSRNIEKGDNGYLYDTCVQLKGHDEEGRPAGEELAPECIIEELNQNYNATGYPLENHVANTLATSNSPYVDPWVDPAAINVPHPDSAEYGGSTLCKIGKQVATTAYKYSGGYQDVGAGAALNDLNGTEKNQYGEYMYTSASTGSHYCHMIVHNGAEVPGAKRPATFTTPAPGGINCKTPILWRPVDTSVTVTEPGTQAPPVTENAQPIDAAPAPQY